MTELTEQRPHGNLLQMVRWENADCGLILSSESQWHIVQAVKQNKQKKPPKRQSCKSDILRPFDYTILRFCEATRICLCVSVCECVCA